MWLTAKGDPDCIDAPAVGPREAGGRWRHAADLCQLIRIGIDAGVANGGRTTVDGEFRNDLQTNSRAGVTLVLPVGRRNGLAIGLSTGVTTRLFGADFDNLLLAFQRQF